MVPNIYTYIATIHLIETQPFVAIEIFVGIESFHQFEFRLFSSRIRLISGGLNSWIATIWHTSSGSNFSWFREPRNTDDFHIPGGCVLKHRLPDLKCQVFRVDPIKAPKIYIKIRGHDEIPHGINANKNSHGNLRNGPMNHHRFLWMLPPNIQIRKFPQHLLGEPKNGPSGWDLKTLVEELSSSLSNLAFEDFFFNETHGKIWITSEASHHFLMDWIRLKEANQLRLVVYPIIYSGFCTSTEYFMGSRPPKMNEHKWYSLSKLEVGKVFEFT